MLMVGPTCAPFCSLNVGWNYSRMQVGNAEDMIADGMRHLAFATHICLEHTRAGRYYALDHPSTAVSWDANVLELLRGSPGATEVEFDFCELGMTSMHRRAGHGSGEEAHEDQYELSRSSRGVKVVPVQARPPARSTAPREGLGVPGVPD